LAVELTSEDKEISLSAASALRQIDDTGAVGPLIQALADSDSTVRGERRVCLSQIGDMRAVQPLIKALLSEQSKMPHQTVKGLSRSLRARRTRT